VGDPITKKPDQTIANFLDNTNNLRPSEYLADIKVADLTPVLKLTFKDNHNIVLGTFQLYKHEKPASCRRAPSSIRPTRRRASPST